MKKKAVTYCVLILFLGALCGFKGLEMKERKLTSTKPPFTLVLPSEFRLIHSFENEGENSFTRAYLYIKERDKQMEELLIVQIADRTNPQAGPISAPRLRSYTEERMYLRDKTRKGEVEVDYMIQLMAWNPDASSLQPIVKKGIVVPPHLALQGQFQFIYQKEHAISIRYSKDVNSFGFKVSDEKDHWNRDSISGDEKKAYEAFKETFMNMMDSIDTKIP
jgi:hypothetical protein